MSGVLGHGWKMVRASGLVWLGAMSSCMLLLDEPFTSTSDCDTGYDDDSCICTQVEEGNDEFCTEDSVGHGFCCADSNYEDLGAGCECAEFSCQKTASGCRCGGSLELPERACTGAICCANYAECTCGSEPCDVGDIQVSECTRDVMPCDDGEERVEGCSSFTPRAEG